VTQEKEEAVNKTKADLQMKEQKAAEEKALQESRSDPESVMSSLTSSTGGESGSVHAKKISSELSSEEGQRKRKIVSECKSGNKKSRKSKVGHSGSSESSAEEQGCRRSKQQSLDKTASSVSDITDSNKGSSNSGSDTQNSSNQRSDDDEASGTQSSISASSNAAVVEGRDGKKPRTKHADVVIKGRNAERRRKHPTEVTSLEESFVLDYEEVFVKSNIPQIIATTAGRIIACKCFCQVSATLLLSLLIAFCLCCVFRVCLGNDFFLKATGISKSGVKGLTIFSLVKQEKLSNLFEIVAKALRNDSASDTSGCSEGESEKSSHRSLGSKWDYATMTLPCIDFPSGKERSTGRKICTNPLYITVSDSML